MKKLPPVAPRRLARLAKLAAAAVFGLAGTLAHASPRICISADTLSFGQRVVGSTTTATASISNCGDQRFSFSDVSVHVATSAAFHVTTTCATGATLEPGASCSAAVRFEPTSPGQVSGALWLHNTTSTPDQLITFYGRGVDAQAGTAALTFVPAMATFGATEVGRDSGVEVVLARNDGTATLVPSAIVINGASPYDFRGEAHGEPLECLVGSPIPPGASCTFNLYFRPTAAGTRRATLLVDAPQLAALAALPLVGDGVTAPPTATVDVVEFRHAPTDQYFLTAEAAEIAFLDGGGLGRDWVRTGQQFRAFARESLVPADAQPTCRFFGTPDVGPNSHFYTVDVRECALVGADPHWTVEGVAFRALPPLAGRCAAGYDAVVRLWKPGADPTGSRHRYTAAPAIVAAMAQSGWTIEGTVFCAPQ
ncbi:MAG: choice-of-anchor D domain-containing protein [Betaproteobacteria bacterium]